MNIIKRALFHRFEGDFDVLKDIVEEGYYISVSPEVIYNKKYGDFVNHVPLENMVLESDGPWEYDGKKGMPSMVMDIITYLSKARNMEEAVVEKIVFENSLKLFGKVL